MLGLAVSAALLVLLLRVVDLNALGDSLRMFDVRMVPLAIALYFAGVWLRSLRWGLLLPHRPSAAELFRALFQGLGSPPCARTLYCASAASSFVTCRFGLAVESNASRIASPTV